MVLCVCFAAHVFLCARPSKTNNYTSQCRSQPSLSLSLSLAHRCRQTKQTEAKNDDKSCSDQGKLHPPRRLHVQASPRQWCLRNSTAAAHLPFRVILTPGYYLRYARALRTRPARRSPSRRSARSLTARLSPSERCVRSSFCATSKVRVAPLSPPQG